jgi:UDP-N-acetylmuramate dehydrogenase
VINSLPPVRGRYTQDADLSKLTWFQVGGKAELLFKPADVQDLSHFLSHTKLPFFVLGVGSNLLVRDGGIDGAVIILRKGFNEITVSGEIIEVGSAVLDRNVAEYGASLNLGGLEFLCSIPGTIGGAVKMNAGCYGTEIKDVLVWADIMKKTGEIERRYNKDFHFSYRHSNVKDDEIVIKAAFQGKIDEKTAITEKMNQMLGARSVTQPTSAHTGGSTFANPPGDKKAWELIDAVGGRGQELGGAQFSKLHCNFLLNTGGATAAEIEDLGEDVRKKVLAQFGIDLRWEIQRIGKR